MRATAFALSRSSLADRLELTKPRSPFLQRFYGWYLSRFMPFVSNLVMKSSAPS